MKLPTLTSVPRRMRVAAAVVGVGALLAVGVASAAPSESSTASSFHTVIPVRVLDTRDGTGASVAPLSQGQILNVVIPGLPDDATAVNVNITVVNGTTAGFLTAFAKGDAKPWTSAVNWSSPRPVANSVVVSVHSDHAVSLFNSAGTVDVIMDLVGFYAPSPSGGSAGAQGVAGPKGDQGDPGNAGLDAPQVSPSPANYLYALHTGAQTVAAGAAVTFASPAELVVGGLTLLGDQSSIVVNVPGPYKVSFSVDSGADSQVNLQVMRSGIPTTSKFGAPAGQNQGSAIRQLQIGDVLSLINGTGSSIALDDDLTGVGNLGIDAWIIVEQLNTLGAPG